jgi:hypothetical protein
LKETYSLYFYEVINMVINEVMPEFVPGAKIKVI